MTLRKFLKDAGLDPDQVLDTNIGEWGHNDKPMISAVIESGMAARHEVTISIPFNVRGEKKQ